MEGPHDLEFCAKLLKPRSFSRIQSLKVLKRDHDFWHPTVPEKWPHNSDDLLARHPVPLFLANPSGQSIAIVNAVGINKIALRLGITLSNLASMPEAVGVILDADDGSTPQVRFDAMHAEIAARPEPAASGLTLPESPGVVGDGFPKSGIFVMPDNHSQGTLEDLILDAAENSYPQLLQAAQSYVSHASHNTTLQESDLEEFNKPAGPKKAVAAAMASILKPGKAIQVSIQDNRWLEPSSLILPRLKKLRDFLDDLTA